MKSAQIAEFVAETLYEIRVGITDFNNSQLQAGKPAEAGIPEHVEFMLSIEFEDEYQSAWIKVPFLS